MGEKLIAAAAWNYADLVINKIKRTMVDQCPPGLPSFESYLATWDAHVTPDDRCGLETWLDLTHPGVDLLHGDMALNWGQ